MIRTQITLDREPRNRATDSVEIENGRSKRLWPGFEGRDLTTRFPGIRRHDLTADEKDVERIARDVEEIVVRLLERIPGATLLVGTVYDPTDGTADLGDGVVREEALSWLHLLNDRLVGIARERGAVPVDIHDHFLGHGLTEPDPEARWYWRHSIIEPSARGASEARRLWLRALGL